MATKPGAQWSTFVSDFFQPPNQLIVGQGIAEVDAIIGAAEGAFAADPPGPVIVPARLAGITHYFCIAFERDQARSLGDLLRSYIGRTWTTFDGRSLAGAAVLDTLEAAAVSLSGGNLEFVFRFEVGPSVRGVVRNTLQSLVRALAERPPREARILLPIGRVLGDFADACAAGAEEAAKDAYARLAADHRISAANRLFLRVQMLASFQEWDELDAAPWLSEVLRLVRPALASDALARLAMSLLPSPPDLAAFEPVGMRFGALIPSVGLVRSVAGARYYVLWSLLAGEPPGRVGERITSAGWADDPILSELLATSVVDSGRGQPDVALDQDGLRDAVTEALATGCFDAAVELLGGLRPSPDDLPVVVVAVRGTLTASSIALLERYRQALGDEAVHEAIEADPTVSNALSGPMDPRVSLAERIDALLTQATLPGARVLHAESIQQIGLRKLLAPGGLDAVVAVIRHKTGLQSDEIDFEDGMGVCLDLARDLKMSESHEGGLRALGLAILEMWAYHDRTGDRRRLRRILEVVDDLTEVGLSASTFDEVVEFLRAGWDPFLTDVDLPAGLDTIELLMPFRPDGSESLDSFARPLLSRIGSHNARRLSTAALDVAVELAREFGLQLAVPQTRSHDAGSEAQVHGAGTVLALYSLMEQAADRAASILRRRYPGMEVVTMADHVASDHLRNLSRSADLVVVMDRAAKHSATEAIRAARGSRPIRFAAGKGSTSLVEAAEAGLREIASPDAA